MSIPIIRLELEHLKETVILAFNEQQLAMDAMLRAELDRYCSEGHLQQVLQSAVREALEGAVRAEVKAFYAYGEGRQIVKDAVLARIHEGTTDLG